MLAGIRLWRDARNSPDRGGADPALVARLDRVALASFDGTVVAV